MDEIKDRSVIGRRPVLITILCILFFIVLFFVFLGLINPAVRTQLEQQRGHMFIPITSLLLILSLAGTIGYLKMRKWGVYLYLIWAVITISGGLIFNLEMGIFDFLLPIAIISIGLAYFKRMI